MESQRIEIKGGERAEVCVRSGETSLTLVIRGPGSISIVTSKENPKAVQGERMKHWQISAAAGS